VLLLLLLLSSAPAGDATEASLARASNWLAAYAASEEPLNFDAVIVLSFLARSGVAGSEAAFTRANQRLDRDRGHPHRRFFEEEFRLPASLSVGWQVPAGPAPRVNPDRLLTEALHCRENGLRPEAVAYACGAMRDGGGYHSVHGLWALVEAGRRGCLSPAGAACLEELRREVAAAQPLRFVPWSTMDIDLYAERLVVLALSGGLPPALAAAPATLLELQNADGSWGLAGDELPYMRFHATMMAAWALAEAGAGANPAAGQKFS